MLNFNSVNNFCLSRTAVPILRITTINSILICPCKHMLLGEAILMSAHNIHFCGAIRTLYYIAPDKTLFFHLRSTKIFLISAWQHNYVVSTHQNCLSEVLPMSAHNICYHAEIKKILPYSTVRLGFFFQNYRENLKVHFKKDQLRIYLMMFMCPFPLIFFIKAYVFGTHLNCLNKLRQFQRVPTTYAFIKK